MFSNNFSRAASTQSYFDFNADRCGLGTARDCSEPEVLEFSLVDAYQVEEIRFTRAAGADIRDCSRGRETCLS